MLENYVRIVIESFSSVVSWVEANYVLLIFLVVALLTVYLYLKIVIKRWDFNRFVRDLSNREVLVPAFFYEKMTDRYRLTLFKVGMIENITDNLPTPNIFRGDGEFVQFGYKSIPGAKLGIIRECFDDLISLLEPISYRIDVDTDREVKATLFYREDTFKKDVVLWEPANREDESIPEAIPLGVNRDGFRTYLPIAQNHILIAGKTGSGKGSIVWSIAGALANRGDVKLFGVDLKGGVEFSLGEGCFTGLAISKDHAAVFISKMYETMEKRLVWLRKNKLRNMPITEQTPLMVMIVDEALDLVAMSKNEDYKDDMLLFEEVLQKGRAAGIVVIAALQNPNLSDFPWAKKFTSQVALRLTDNEQAGFFNDWSSLDVFDLSKLNTKDKGICMIKDEEGSYQVVKVYYPTDDVIKDLSGEA